MTVIIRKAPQTLTITLTNPNLIKAVRRVAREENNTVDRVGEKYLHNGLNAAGYRVARGPKTRAAAASE